MKKGRVAFQNKQISYAAQYSEVDILTMKKTFTKKRILILLSILVLLIAGLIIYMANSTPIYGSWWNQDQVELELAWNDYKGINHQKQINSPEKIEQISSIFKLCQDEAKRVLIVPNGRSGSIEIQIVLSGDLQDVIYGISGEYIAVSHDNNKRSPTFYKVSSECSENIISALELNE